MTHLQSLPTDLQDAAFWQRLALNSSRLSDMRDSVAQRMVPHNLRILSPKKRLDGRVQGVDLGSTSINYINYGTDVLIAPLTTNNCYFVDIPLTGISHTISGQSEAEVGRGFISISSVTRPVEYLQESDCSLLAFKVPRQTLERYLVEQTGSPLREPIEFQLMTKIQEGQGQSFLQVVTHLCEVLQLETSTLGRSTVADAAERYALMTLLNTIPNNYSDRLASGQAEEPAPYYVEQAEDYILGHLDQPINLEDLVAITGVSSRSLIYEFKKTRGLPPIAYVRRERLRQARNELLTNDPTTASVTDVAMKWGFSNMGGFAALYAKQYGEKPLETLRRSVIDYGQSH